MRSRVILILATFMMAAVLAACGTAATPTSAPVATQAVAPAATATKAAPAAIPTAAATVALPTATRPAATSAASFPLTLTDDAGRSVTIKSKPKAVVSLAPSNTEIVYAVGADAQLVGVSDLDDYPPQVSEKKKVGGGFQPNLEQIMALNPDLVLTIGGNQDLVTQMESKSLTVLVLDPKDMDGIYKDIEMAGNALGAAQEGAQLADGMRARAAAVAAKVKGAAKPKVFFEIDATDPTKPFTGGPGSFIDILINQAGGENVAAKAASQWAQLSSEEIVADNPDIIVLADANVPGNPQSAETVAARSGWGSIKAVKDGKILVIDTNLVSRPGPRIVDGLEALAKMLHPELFQ